MAHGKSVRRTHARPITNGRTLQCGPQWMYTVSVLLTGTTKLVPSCIIDVAMPPIMGWHASALDVPADWMTLCALVWKLKRTVSPATADTEMGEY